MLIKSDVFVDLCTRKNNLVPTSNQLFYVFLRSTEVDYMLCLQLYRNIRNTNMTVLCGSSIHRAENLIGREITQKTLKEALNGRMKKEDF